MASRQALIHAVISPARLRAATMEESAFQGFLSRLDIERSSDALILYLTHLANTEGLTANVLRDKLALLSLTQRLAGEAGWRADPAVRAYLRGLHRDLPLGPTQEQSDPIYRETLRAMIDARMLPSHDRLRDRALLLIANETLWPARGLYRLRWQHVRFYGNRVEVELPPLRRRDRHAYADRVTIRARNDDLCPVAALRALRGARVPQDGLVFASHRGACDATPVERLVAFLPRKSGSRSTHPIRYRTDGDPLRRILGVVTAPDPVQLRDAALLLVGYGAALRTNQAISLKQSDVSMTSAGLILDIAGRDQPTGIPVAERGQYCALSAWTRYMKEVCVEGLQDPAAPAFLTAEGRTLRLAPMGPHGLNDSVTRAAQAAQLTGRYSFAGLRAGFIRTSVRDGAARHEIAVHAGYRYLDGVLWHERREQLIRTSVAGELGL